VNRSIRHLAIGLMGCYLALFVMLNLWQVARSEELGAAPDNTRQTLRDFNRPRGPIITADAQVVARSVPAAPGGTLRYRREYPLGDLFAHITGFHSFGLGSTQLERTRSEVLVGTTAEQQLLAIPGLITGETDNAGSVTLTMRADLQREARRLLADQEGSIVVVDVRSGAVLAMWSYPSFDPNLLADPDYDAAYAAMADRASRSSPPRSVSMPV
jgi:peptidoglycan glycosyltransferase